MVSAGEGSRSRKWKTSRNSSSACACNARSAIIILSRKWSQNDYYSFSAFFTQLGRKPTTTKENEAIFQPAWHRDGHQQKDPSCPCGLRALNHRARWTSRLTMTRVSPCRTG